MQQDVLSQQHHKKLFYDALWDHPKKLEFPPCKQKIVCLTVRKYNDLFVSQSRNQNKTFTKNFFTIPCGTIQKDANFPFANINFFV
jgi:hypothetical protein